MTQPVTLQEKIGRNLKELLRQKHLTQEKFAEYCSVEARTVRKWIQKGIDKISVVEQIAIVLEIGIKDVMML